MKNQKIYGISKTLINNHVIHSFKIRITRTLFNEEVIKNSGLYFYYSSSKKGIEMINIEYVTMDINDFNFKKRILVESLKEIALNKLEEKYKIMAY